jgi:hypothetical protein
MSPEQHTTQQAADAESVVREVYRRLVAFHHPMAESLDPEREAARRTRKQIEDVMHYIEDGTDKSGATI